MCPWSPSWWAWASTPGACLQSLGVWSLCLRHENHQGELCQLRKPCPLSLMFRPSTFPSGLFLPCSPLGSPAAGLCISLQALSEPPFACSAAGTLHPPLWSPSEEVNPAVPSPLGGITLRCVFYPESRGPALG